MREGGREGREGDGAQGNGGKKVGRKEGRKGARGMEQVALNGR